MDARAFWSPHRFAMVAAAVAAPVIAIFLSLAWRLEFMSPGAQKGYFPPPGDPRVTARWARSWAPFFAWELEAAGEAPWWKGISGVYGYRFTWERSFGPLIIVRVEKTATGAVATWHRSAGWNFGTAKFDSGHRTISAEEWSAIELAFDSSRFWTAPAREYDSGADGATWLVEGLRGGSYQLWSAWSPLNRPAPAKPIAEAALALVRAADQMPSGPMY